MRPNISKFVFLCLGGDRVTSLARIPIPAHRRFRPSLGRFMSLSARGGEVQQISESGDSGSLERLCTVSLEACERLTPLISSIYRQILDGEDGLKTSKEDQSAFTIADGLTQRLIVDSLYSQVDFRGIVGEEEDSHDDDGGDGNWYRVQGLEVPNDLRPLVDATRSKIASLSPALAADSYRNLTVFVDPIDGTREFSSGRGEQCSICIGFADARGRAVAGVVYRPLTQPPTWAAGAFDEGYSQYSLGETRRGSGLLTTNGSISPFVEALIEELGLERVRSGGAGNKMLILLASSLASAEDGGGSCLYIQDRGVSRWDTCAAEAILRAFGGDLVKLEPDEEPHYTYLETDCNLDFVPGLATCTKYNSRTNDALGERVNDVESFKPYSNLCGMIAFGKEFNTDDGRRTLRDAIRKASKRVPPSYD